MRIRVLPAIRYTVGLNDASAPIRLVGIADEIDGGIALGAFIGSRWGGAIIPYKISPNFTQIATLNAALNALESATKLRFVKRQGSDKAYVEVRNHSALCRSPVGRQGGKQTVGCAPFGFGVGSLTHEFCHAVGMIHEHQRSDRNSFVQIISANINPQRGHNFIIQSRSRNNSIYDLASMMHYGPGAFSDGTGPTIQSLSGAAGGGGSVLTNRDIQALNAEYPTLGVVRRSDSAQGAGKIRSVSVARLAGSSSRFVTAVRTSAGRLRLIEWRTHSLGGVTRIADSGNTAGKATHIDIHELETRTVL